MIAVYRSFIAGFILGLAPAFSQASVLPDSIRLFVNGTASVAGHPSIKIWIHDVRSVGSVARFLSHELAARESVARRQAAQRIEQNFNRIKTALRAESELVALIDRFGIKRYPAAVVDESMVIYGSADIQAILTAWRAASW